MNKTIGILAHVDAGKTTFCENLLYYFGVIRSMGRVDHKNSFMDTYEIEKERGITVFAENGVFEQNGNTYYLIDTPGHRDFSAETERAACVLDYAIVVISGTDGVQAHTVTLYRLLKKYGIPVFFFINKTDSDNCNLPFAVEDIKRKLTDDVVYIEGINDEALAEFAAERDEYFLERYTEAYSDDELRQAASRVIKNGLGSVIMSGSALKSRGVKEFFEVFDMLTPTAYSNEGSFKGEVFKIRHSAKGERLTYVKLLEGRICVKEEIAFGESIEKINEIRIYNGRSYKMVESDEAGQIAVFTGIKSLACGDVFDRSGIITRNKYTLVPALEAGVEILDNTDVTTCLAALRLLEEEEPLLYTEYRKSTDEIIVKIMGKIQTEILEYTMRDRFDISVSFKSPKVRYKETIRNAVTGIGHYEPLRHYAEVQLRLEPLKRNSGIEYESRCHVDTLAANYQSLVKTHIFEREHKGVLTGSPVTDVKYVLVSGRAHIKHTEGGDFREAVYRGVRQGLEKAESILLEPFYSFIIYIDEEYAGRVMTDIAKMRGSLEPPESLGGIYTIRGRGPVAEFMSYPDELAAFTRGTGSISLVFDGYDECSVSDSVIEDIAYDKGADRENTSCSVFCKKGAGYTVNWYEVDELAHTLK